MTSEKISLNFGEKPRQRMSINITSLVDILIVLLMFFMLTTQFSRMEVLNLDLAGKVSDTQAIKNDKSPVIITLTGSGKFLLSGKQFDLIFLKDKLTPLLAENKARPIAIFSNEKAAVQDVVTAMDYIRVIGGTNVSLAEEKNNAK